MRWCWIRQRQEYVDIADGGTDVGGNDVGCGSSFSWVSIEDLNGARLPASVPVALAAPESAGQRAELGRASRWRLRSPYALARGRCAGPSRRNRKTLA